MKISLIITVFNSAKYVASAIDSFLAQDYLDKELIILDGKSTDKSHEIIAKYAEKFPNIKWIKENDSGISHARNIALKQISGDLVGFLGADDILHKDFFTKMTYYAKINPNFDVIYFNSYTIGLTNSFDASTQISITKRNLIKHCPIASGESFYYKKSVFDKFSFNENNRYSMDYELNMALVSSRKNNGEKYYFFPVNLEAVFNGSFGDSISSASSLKQRIETIVVQLKYAKNFGEKFSIIYRKKKMILRNLKQFLEIKKKIGVL